MHINTKAKEREIEMERDGNTDKERERERRSVTSRELPEDTDRTVISSMTRLC